MLTVAHSIVLGLVEGFTEFLPISSTAHLILASYVLGIGQSAIVKTFEISIQSGAILAVVLLYWKRFLDIEILKRLIVAFIPTGIIGLILYKIVKGYLIGNIAVVLIALAVGGIVLIMIERKPRQGSITDIRTLSYKKSALIGLAQSVAIIPGVSRSAATIVGGMLMDISKDAIVEFSFLLAVPTMLAATGLDLVKNIGDFNSNDMAMLAIGGLVSFAAALVGIKFLLSYVRRSSFRNFGIYRIAIVLIFLMLFI